MTSTKKTRPTTHPSVARMVKAALKDLSSRAGVSLFAIKKYITANYVTDMGRLAHFIRSYLKKAVVTGILLRVTGTGARGSFRLNSTYKPAVPTQKAKTPQRSKTPKAPIPSAPKKAKTPPVSSHKLWRPIPFTLL